jgi:tubulin monoglycylase TTLL3/8
MQNSFDLTHNYILPDNIVVIARPTVFIGNNKPNITACSGEGVMVIHDNNSLEKAKEQLKNYQNILLSDYITNPLLFQNKKFHLRMYFFATINNNIFRTYLLNFGYIYTALLPYKNAEYNNKNIHDTHWGTTSKDFIYPNSLMHLGGDNVNNITSQMRTILYRTSMILYNEKVSNYENSANSYYIFGVDFMIKDKLDNFDVVLIEINHSPGFKHKNPNDNTLEHRIFTFVNKISFNPLLTKSDPIIDKNDISTIPLLVKTLN